METLKEGFLRKNLGLGKEVLIKKWLDKYNIKNYTINDDLTIDVNGSVYLTEYREEYLPDYIQFGNIKGSFYIQFSDIISLQGCPKEVSMDFNCSDCKYLTSLKNSPQKVGESFICSDCKNLTSLEGVPENVNLSFHCNNCSGLKSLEGAPQKVGGGFNCSFCSKLESLKGAPQKVGWSFKCSSCPKSESLVGAPKKVGGYFECSECGKQFTIDDVDKISKVHGEIYV